MNTRYYSKDGTVYATVEGSTMSGKTIFCVHYGERDRYGTDEAHEVKLYDWAQHLHGNPPSGTPYGYFRASRNGKRVIITV